MLDGVQDLVEANSVVMVIKSLALHQELLKVAKHHFISDCQKLAFTIQSMVLLDVSICFH